MSERSSKPHLEPPPRRAVRPASPRRRAAARGVGFGTILVFSLLGIAAVAVFGFLPTWVDEPQPTVVPQAPVADVAETEPAPSAPSIPEPDPSNAAALRDAAGDRLAARRALEGLAGRVDDLERRGAADWGGATWRDAEAAIEAGRQRFEARDFAAALNAWDEAGGVLDAVDARAEKTLDESLRAGNEALAAGDAVAAGQAFERALLIAPNHAEAKAGRHRADVWDQVATLLADAYDAETRGELGLAASLYTRARSLDLANGEASRGLGRVQARLADDAFGRVMSEGFDALAEGDFGAARKAFARARTMRPAAADQVTDAVAQVDATERRTRLASHRAAGRVAEVTERFREAIAEYEAALAIDASIEFARDGLARAKARAELADAVDRALDRPDRLASSAVLTEAERLLRRAEAVADPGPSHRDRTARLAALIERYAEPVVVELRSDGATEVTVYRVGRLGAFERRSLELRPGTYTVVGQRPGHRDVRLELVVEPGTVPGPLDVRATETVGRTR